MSAYAGWDEVAGEFRMDASLAEIKDHYRRIGEENAATDSRTPRRKVPVKPAASSERTTS